MVRSLMECWILHQCYVSLGVTVQPYGFRTRVVLVVLELLNTNNIVQTFRNQSPYSIAHAAAKYSTSRFDVATVGDIFEAQIVAASVQICHFYNYKSRCTILL
jgi:hypothetical protein